MMQGLKPDFKIWILSDVIAVSRSKDFVKHCRNEMAKQPNLLQVEENNFAPSIGPLWAYTNV